MTQTLILVTILLITQVTELKLLFETQVSQHRFYYVIMASLITCIAIEILIGLVTVYVTQKRSDFWSRMTSDSKAKNQDPKAAIYTGCHGKSSSGWNYFSRSCLFYFMLNLCDKKNPTLCLIYVIKKSS